MGGWFNQEFRSVCDLAGSKMRSAGLGGRVMSSTRWRFPRWEIDHRRTIPSYAVHAVSASSVRTPCTHWSREGYPFPTVTATGSALQTRPGLGRPTRCCGCCNEGESPRSRNAASAPPGVVVTRATVVPEPDPDELHPVTNHRCGEKRRTDPSRAPPTLRAGHRHGAPLSVGNRIPFSARRRVIDGAVGGRREAAARGGDAITGR